MRTTTKLALLAACAGPAAIAATLLRDINAVPVPHAGFVYPWTASLAAGSVFVADDNVHGVEPWITDGTPQGTHLLRDINAGKPDSEIYAFTVLGGVAYFYADDGVNGRELWRTDGTVAGTRIVVNIGPGTQGAAGTEAIYPIGGGVFLFTAEDGTHGQELWRSDGTAAGTHIVADIAPGADSAFIESMVSAGNRVVFKATDSAGEEPWVSDGTAAGTHRIGDINPGAGGSSVGNLTAVGGTVFFSATDPVHGAELWRLKAGDQLATLVVDLNTELSPDQPPAGQPAHTLGSAPHDFFVSGDSLLYIATTTSGSTRTDKLYRATASGNTVVPLNTLGPADDIYQLIPVGAHGAVFATTSPGMTTATSAILVTDGTTAGSQSLASQDVWFTGTTMAFERSADGNEVYFFAHSQNGAGDIDLWRSDGTVANTRVFADVNDIIGSSDLRRVGNQLFFGVGYAGDGHGKEMWVSDGTPAGTHMIRDLNPGEPSSQPYAVQVVGNKVVFAAFTTTDPATFWVTDGTDAGTLPLAKIPVDYETYSSGVYSLGASPTDLFYMADDGVNGSALWASNGTTAGTRLVKDLAAGNASASSLPMMSLGAVQIFSDRDVIWRTDGTTAGTYPLVDTAPGVIGDVWWPLYGNAPSVIGGIGYFFSTDGTHTTLWRTNGTVAGTALVSDVTAIAPYVLDLEGAFNSRLFILGVTSSAGNVLYSTDGTPGGTVLVSPTHQLSGPAKAFAGRLCFVGNDGVPHPVPNGSYFVNDIFCSDGTAGDIVRLTDGNDHDRNAGEFFVAGSLMFVNSYAQDSTSGVWVTDGVPGTSRQLLTEHASDVARYNGNYLIATYDNPSGPRLLLSDGTTAGTRDLLQGATVDGDLTGQFTVFSNVVLFTVKGAHGVTIWRTDGTPAGTKFLADVNPSTSLDEYPLDFRTLGDKLVFSSAHPVFGGELWTMSATAPNAGEDSLRVPYESTATVAVLVNDADIDGTLAAGSVQVVDAPASGTTSVDTGTGAIAYTANAGFTGIDSFTYRVADNQGNWSNAAKVSVIVTQPVGGDPAAAPSNLTPAPMPVAPTDPPIVDPPPTNPPGGGGGGGGALGLECAALALLWLLRRYRASSRMRAMAER